MRHLVKDIRGSQKQCLEKYIFTLHMFVIYDEVRNVQDALNIIWRRLPKLLYRSEVPKYVRCLHFINDKKAKNDQTF